MDPNDLPRLVYLVLLLAVVGGYFIVESRGRIGKRAQQAAIWGLIFLGAVAVAGLWGDLRRAVLPGEAVVRGEALEVPVSPDGHYYLTAEVNGARVLFVVDTGASEIVLTQRDAGRAGLDPDRFAVGGVEERGVPAVVNGGPLDTSLLGMSWLGRHEATFSRDRLVIRR
jgi:aspartyl protease family protein